MGGLGILVVCVAVGLAWAGAPARATGAPRTVAKSAAHAAAPRAEAPRRQPGGPGARAAAPRAQRGEASYYAPRLAGRRMADGGRFDPGSDAAAHRTLPLGSKARVRNLENGRSAEVTVRDRGPHAPGRILDVSPRTAERLGMRGEGVAPVEVAPLGASRSGGEAGPGPGSTGGGAPEPARPRRR